MVLIFKQDILFMFDMHILTDKGDIFLYLKRFKENVWNILVYIFIAKQLKCNSFKNFEQNGKNIKYKFTK